MKSFHLAPNIAWVILLASLAAKPAQAGSSTQGILPASIVKSPYSIVERGPHHRIWQRVTTQTNISGEVIYRTNSYTELATGMHHWDGRQWIESTDQIQITPDGAAATNGQYQVRFAANINTAGSIDLTTPDNIHMRSHVVGLAYYDSSTSNSVMIAELHDAIGQLIRASNQVIYTNAFTDFAADVRYTYRIGKFEQDIILRQQPPSPAQYGLNPQTTRLQIWTEFIGTPAPRILQMINKSSGLGDQKLNFGSMRMRRGNAFSIGQENVLVPVTKRWNTIENRSFLIEELPLRDIAPKLQTLPPMPPSPSGSNPVAPESRGGNSSLRRSSPETPAYSSSRKVFDQIDLPPPKAKKQSSVGMQLVNSPPNQNGVILDYVSIVGDTTTSSNYTFKGDTTYLISRDFEVDGVSIFEGGTVIKSSTNGGTITAWGGVNCLTAPYRPASFTVMDDDSIGETISGSTGTPTAYAGGILTYSTTLHDLHFAYCGPYAINDFGDDVLNLTNIQFVHCACPVYYELGIFRAYNILVHDFDTFLNVSSSVTADIEHLTADTGNTLITVDGDSPSSIGITNSLISDVPLIHPSYGPDTNLATFQLTSTEHVATYAFGIGAVPSIFQTVGAGKHYLIDGSPYRNAGTTNIGTNLLAALKQKTTYPPIVLSNITNNANCLLSPQAQRDTGTNPDLGYHYDPLDFIADNYQMTNATLTITSGTAIAFYNESAGIWLQQGSTLVSIGTPLSPNWFTHYLSVQEQSLSIGSSTPSTCCYINPDHAGTGPNATFRFSKFSGPSTLMICHSSTSGFAFNNLLVQDCEFWAGGSSLSGNDNGTATINNCLFVRSIPNVQVSNGSTTSFTNNLFWCAAFTFESTRPSASLSAFNNIFDNCTITTNTRAVSSDYNAYILCTGGVRLNPNGAHDLVLSTNLTYQSGPLGDYYQGSTNLINAGSTTADLVGLYHYTTQTSQVKETNSIVDIGYHYVAVDGSGNPIDTDGDGVPDYVEDANGNGSVDSGETDWNDPNDLGLQVIITRPKNNSIIP